MKKEDILVFMLSCLIPLLGLVVKSYAPEEKMILSKQYPQVCHFALGEGTVIDSCWILTGGYLGSSIKKELDAGQSPTVTCDGKTYSIEKVIIPSGFKNSEDGVKPNIALVKIKGIIQDTNEMPSDLYSKEKGRKF